MRIIADLRSDGTMEDALAELFGNVPTDRMKEAGGCFRRHNYRRAFELYKECAEEGDNLARCRLGAMYAEGLGTDRRPLKAFELISEAYDPDDLETVFWLGRCHYEGIGTEEDTELGFEMIVSAADAGYPQAEGYVAARYLDGVGMEMDANRGMHWLKKAVEHGDPAALTLMGDLMYEGKLVSFDRTGASKLWRRSYELGNVPAIAKLGHYLVNDTCYANEDTQRRKYEEGAALLEEAAELGDMEAAAAVGDHYLKRADDPAKAIRFYEMARRNGNTSVCYDLAMIYHFDKNNMNLRKALECLKEGLEGGDQRCTFDYAIMNYRGEGTSVDMNAAFELFLKGAEAGHIPSMEWVGVCYLKGNGTARDLKEAKRWLELGHDKGSKYCSTKLGEMYLRAPKFRLMRERGLDLLHTGFERGEAHAAFFLGNYYEKWAKNKSVPDAIYWYGRGADKGDADCMIALAKHYEKRQKAGRPNVTGSKKRIFELYRKAYEACGDPSAAAEVGRCFEDGVGTETDQDAALYWYLKAKGDRFAMWRLSDIYLGNGEMEKAVFWLRRAAATGYVDAMIRLAGFYEEGRGVPESEYMAMNWYHRAADHENEYARCRFEELSDRGPMDEIADEYEIVARRIGEDRDDDSILDLADRLAYGKDMPVDLHRAKAWCEIAVQLGVKDAKERLDDVTVMTAPERDESMRQMTFD